MRTYTVTTSMNLQIEVKADDFFVESDGSLVFYNREENSDTLYVASHKVAAFAPRYWAKAVEETIR